MATLHDGVFVPTRDPNAAYGSEQWLKDNVAEEVSRPRVLPLNKRHFWTPSELQRLRDNRAAGMSEKDAVVAALAPQTV